MKEEEIEGGGKGKGGREGGRGRKGVELSRPELRTS